MTLSQDLRYAWRTLARRPVFTVAAVVTLALGIGLNSAVFSGVHSLVLRPLQGVAEPDRLVQVFRSYPGDFQYASSSIPHFFDMRERTEAFADATAWKFVGANLATGGEPELAMAQMVSASFFDVFGVRPVLGRTFRPEEDVGVGAHPVVVLSHATWEDRFGRDPAVVGRTLTINGLTYEVIGVAPEAFRGPVPLVVPAFWAPLTMQPQLEAAPSEWELRNDNSLNIVARLKPGITFEQAVASADAAQRSLAEEYPAAYGGSTTTLVTQADGGISPGLVRAQRAMSVVLMAVVGLLLLLACVNVANLFLTRAQERRREMAVRLSVGAKRRHLVRQLLIESLLLSLVAGLIGLGLARLAVGLANGVTLPMDAPIDFDIRLSTPVMAFTFGLAVLTGVLFGLAPALQASRPELVSALKSQAGTEMLASGRSRTTRVLVAAQLALSVLLLVGAGLFLRSLERAMAMDKGFEEANLLVASLDPPLQGYDADRSRQLLSDIVQRVRALPGVRAAGIGEMLPMNLGSQQTGVTTPGYVFGEDERNSFDYNYVGPGYFEAMGVPLVEGRAIEERDAGQNVALVNRKLAERFWPGQSAVGRVIHRGDVEYRVIGVTETGKYRTLGEDPLDYVYFAFGADFNETVRLHVRTTGDPAALAPLVRAEIRALDPGLPLFDVKTMERHLGLALLPARLAGTLLGIFGLLGLVLAAVGTYGVMAYSVAQRTREMGIRMALGAGRRDIVRLVLGQGGRLAAAGLGVGLLLAVVGARLLEGLLYGVSALDPVAFGVVPLTLAAVALLASYLPARRAAAVEPMRALKVD